MDDVEDYFWRKPTEYHSYYHMRYYGYVDLITLIFALICNTFIIIVVTRKNMASRINTVLSHYIFSQSIAGVCYIPRVWQEYIRVEKCSIPQHRTYRWELISILSYGGAFIFRHTGVWLGVELGLWRYIAILHPLKENQLCSWRNTRLCIIASYVSTIIVTITVSFCVNFGPAVKLIDRNGCSTSNYTIGKNVTIYEFQLPVENDPLLFTLAFLSAGVLLKIVPSVILAVVSYKLVVSLIKNAENRKKMVTSKFKNTYNTRMKLRITKQTDRTTMILLVILMLFVIGEIPHGIFCLLSVHYGRKFFWKYYFYWMEIFNFITMVTESMNFFVYYTMSSQFRDTFKALFYNYNKFVTSQNPSSSISINKI